MTEYVLLTDDNNSTAMVACPDAVSAEGVAAAATMSDGDVSAWLVPEAAITDWERVREILRGGGSCDDVHDAGLVTARREAG